MCVTEDVTLEIPEGSLLASYQLLKAPLSFPPSYGKRKEGDADVVSYGVAIDLGTTTIALYLCCRQNGEVLSSVALKNPQAMYGDDVMNRIGAIGGDGEKFLRMRKMVTKAIAWGIDKLFDSRSFKREYLSQMVAVGNPAMIHILLGVDPKPIGISPYRPAFHEARTTSSESLGFDFENVPLLTLPQISGFVGGDILSAALATDLSNQPDGTLLVDLGTNGELLFKAGDRLYATSCATGPAFEGASLSCGIQAIPGAVNKVEIYDRAEFPRIGVIAPGKNADPVGICGTGIISAVAELVKKKLITPGGAFIDDGGVLPLQRDEENIPAYHLVRANTRNGGTSLHISQKDIRSVQLGKAALFTGIQFLARAAGYPGPTKIIIAGAFGSAIEKEDMIAIGMLPEIELEKIEVAGNSAGAGAVMVLCENGYLSKSRRLAETITTIELATDIGFQEAFIDNLGF